MPIQCICLVCGRSFLVTQHTLGKTLGKKGHYGKYCSWDCYLQRPQPTLEERFWGWVTKTEDCWFWHGMTSRAGYGRFSIDGKHYQSHRVSYALTYGAILSGLFVCHHCDVRHCVRPDHLFLGTAGDNLRDMVAKHRSASQTHPEIRRWTATHTLRRHPERQSRGERQHLSKLTEAQVRTIRALYAEGTHSYAALATLYAVGKSTIASVLTGQTWTHVS